MGAIIPMAPLKVPRGFARRSRVFLPLTETQPKAYPDIRRSLFAKIRDAALSLGQSERTAARKARRVERAAFADFVRLTPEQSVKLGLSRKSRHYVLKDVKRIASATNGS
jgi:hypothetical protein